MAKDFSIRLVPYEAVGSSGFKKMFKELQRNTIIVIDAKLSAEEEASIIEATMEEFSDSFIGIEIGSLDLEELVKTKDEDPIFKIRRALVNAILGKKRGLTVIGPASIVKSIKKNPKDLLVKLG